MGLQATSFLILLLTLLQISSFFNLVEDHFISCVNVTIQFTFFLVMRLNIANVTGSDSLILIFVPKFFTIKA